MDEHLVPRRAKGPGEKLGIAAKRSETSPENEARGLKNFVNRERKSS
jgi:hypothetical protein